MGKKCATKKSLVIDFKCYAKRLAGEQGWAEGTELYVLYNVFDDLIRDKVVDVDQLAKYIDHYRCD